jgi:tetracycline 7-halogenase / FADH2 O2-dependent halogenase
MIRSNKYDFLVVGSGFGGSITAMGLANLGYDVCVVERWEHPRFAIGESSTPVADMILRDLADKYNLPFLKKLSRYGEWQKHHPEIVCGLKRGFSYYPHQKGELFKSDQSHTNELLVAASMDNENSDTNWLRSDVDHFLIQQLQGSGVDYSDLTTVTKAGRVGNEWNILADKEGASFNFTTDWIIDATGSPLFSEKFLGTTSTSDGFETNSIGIYSHFEGAGHWQNYLDNEGFYADDYPYNPDHSALHHLIEEGWIWMLRFNNDLLSAGLVIDGSTHSRLDYNKPKDIWNEVLQPYPSVQSLFQSAVLAESPGKMIISNRLQRRLNRIYGEGWIALNHTAGFVDPLHSTGIAHTFTGVEKLLNFFEGNSTKDGRLSELDLIETNYFKELELIDLLVSSCYKSRGNFKLFTAAVMLYFAASIQYEQGRLNGKTPDSFLCASDEKMFTMVKKTHADIVKVSERGFPAMEVCELVKKIKTRIAPYNQVGLMDASKQNMYEHTAVVL